MVSGALLLGLATALIVCPPDTAFLGLSPMSSRPDSSCCATVTDAVRGSWARADDGSMRLQLQAPGSKAGLSLASLADGAAGITVRDSAGPFTGRARTAARSDRKPPVCR